MAFLNINPELMLLPRFARVLVEGRPKYARVVIPRTLATNEDLAIVTVSNLPPGEVPFAFIRNVVLGLIEGEYGLRVTDIQGCPFGRGQAFVRLRRVSDMNSLVLNSPHQHQGLSFQFVNHNRGANARRVLFNRECWLLLIGYPVDNHNMDDIRDLIKPFGRLICWQKDDILARIIIKARVTDLADVPHYIILSEGDDHEGISLTVHCEIVQQVMIGGQLQDEDIPPGGFDDNDLVYSGFEGNWIQNFHEQHFPENQQNNPLPIPEVPDLNDPVQEEMLE